MTSISDYKDYYSNNLTEKERQYNIDKLTNKEIRKLRRLDLLEILGNKCIDCGIIDFDLLDLHHINYDGTQDREIFNQPEMIRYYIINPDKAKQKLIILCCNCHRKRHRKYLRSFKNER